MDFIGGLIYQMLPTAATHNIWFVLGVVIAYAVLSEVMPFLPGKYNGIAHSVLSILGIWKVKAPVLNTIGAAGGPLGATSATGISAPDKVEPMSIDDAPKMGG